MKLSQPVSLLLIILLSLGFVLWRKEHKTMDERLRVSPKSEKTVDSIWGKISPIRASKFFKQKRHNKLLIPKRDEHCHKFETEKSCNRHVSCLWKSKKKSCQLKSPKNHSSVPDYMRQKKNIAVSIQPTAKPTYHPIHSWPFSCSNQLIETILDDPCYDYESGAQKRIKECGCGRKARLHYNEISYVIPAPTAEDVPLSKAQLANDTIFVFIHVNKAAGTTVKRALFKTAKSHKWDAAAYGTFRAWKRLGPQMYLRQVPTTNSPNISNENSSILTPLRRELSSTNTPDNSIPPVRIRTEPLYISCGHEKYEKINRSTSLYESYGQCKLRAVWGGLSMGLCDHFPNRPCVYFILIRDPLERAVSDYNYFCAEGAEQKHKWTSFWLAQDKCTANIVQYFQQRITSPLFLVERLTRGCDSDCGVETAKANLMHPCMRYLLLDDLEDGLERLSTLYGAPMSDTFANMVELKQRNKHSLAEQTKRQVEDAELMAQLRLLLKADYEIYNHAKNNYLKQWDQPLYSCNSLS